MKKKGVDNLAWKLGGLGMEYGDRSWNLNYTIDRKMQSASVLWLNHMAVTAEELESLWVAWWKRERRKGHEPKFGAFLCELLKFDGLDDFLVYMALTE